MLAEDFDDAWARAPANACRLAVWETCERALAAAAVVAVAVTTTWCVLVGLGFLLVVAPGLRTVLGGATGPGLIPVLQQTGLAELVWAALVATALVVCG